MNIYEIIMISISLAMDAFAVSICKGLVSKKNKIKEALMIGGAFGFFQGFMPIIGYYLGIVFKNKIVAIDHWVAFILLFIIGINMIFENTDDESKNTELNILTILFLAVATSIDALAIGITFAFLNVNLLFAAIIIAFITFILSFIGYTFGNKIGDKLGSKAEKLGGITLILLGLKILLEHLGVI